MPSQEHTHAQGASTPVATCSLRIMGKALRMFTKGLDLLKVITL